MKLNWKKFSVTAAIAGALLLTTVAVVFSQNPPQRPDGPPGPPRGPFGHGPHGPRGGGFGPLAGLNFSDAQKEQIKQIHESFAEQTKALRNQMRTLHESQSDPVSGTFDEAAVRSSAEARAKVQVEMEVTHAKMMSQVANVLTPEQRADLAERHKHRRKGPPRPPSPPGEPEF